MRTSRPTRSASANGRRSRRPTARAAVEMVRQEPLFAYGATLLAALATEHCIVLTQLGDGDIVEGRCRRHGQPAGAERRAAGRQPDDVAVPIAMRRATSAARCWRSGRGPAARAAVHGWIRELVSQRRRIPAGRSRPAEVIRDDGHRRRARRDCRRSSTCVDARQRRRHHARSRLPRGRCRAGRCDRRIDERHETRKRSLKRALTVAAL